MSKVILGRVARKAGPNRVVRPPTQATAGSFSRDSSTYSEWDVTTTHPALIPPGSLAAGDLYWHAIAIKGSSVANSAVSSGLEGYTILYNQTQGDPYRKRFIFAYKVADGTETTESLTTADNSYLSAVSGRVPLPSGVTPVVEFAGPSTTAGGDPLNADPITPTTPGLYAVLVVGHYNGGGPSPDAAGAAPTNYELVGHAASDDATGRRPRAYVAGRAVQIATSEDPGAVGWNDNGVGTFDHFRTYTVAVLLDGGAPAIMPGDAEHDDLGGRDSDDNHPQYSLVDGTRAYTGDLSMGSNKITDVTDPTSDQDAATKKYVDDNAGGASELNDLSDVDLSTPPTDNQILRFDNGSGTWLPEDLPGAGSFDLADADDVTISTPADNEVLAYDNGTSEWINQTAAEAGLSAAGHSHTESDISDLDHDDTDAIHDNVSGEIAAVTEKTTPHDDDLLLIEDSEASNVKKRLKISNLPTGSGSLPTGTTAGDLAVYNGSSWVRLGAGADDTVLTADSGETEGVKWAAAAGGGGGGLTLLATETVSSSVANVEITGISQDYTDLLVVCELTTADSADQDFLRLQLGDGSIDTGANYMEGYSFNGTSGGGANSNSASRIQASPGAKGAGDSTSNALSQTVFEIRRYAESQWTFVSSTAVKSGDSYYFGTGNGVWRSTDPVSRVRISADGGNLTAGKVLVYGR